MPLSAAALVGLVATLNATFPYSPSAPRDALSLNRFVTTLHKNWELNHAEFAAPGGADGLPGYTCGSQRSSKNAPPTSVMDVEVADFEVVAAMGDSITAGFGAGATSIFSGVLTEFRGLSYSIGADKDVNDVVTTYNIQKDRFNGALVGGSKGTGTSDPQLNVAVSGAVSLDMPGQANVLVSKLQDMGATKKWKLITLFIGGNDLCAWCNDKAKYSVAAYTDSVRRALRVIRDNTNNTIVNFVPTIDVTQLNSISGGLCSLLHQFECPCGVASASVRAEVSAHASKLHVAANELEVEAEFRDRQDFAVVVQPFMTNTTVPKKSDGSPDKSYFSPDCFHLSKKGHHAMANALWNNMFEAGSLEGDGDKEDFWEGPKEKFHCPKENEYIWVPPRV